MNRFGNGIVWNGWRSAFAAVLLLASGLASASSLLPHSEDPGDCATCHGGEAVLPPGHVPTSGMDAATCTACHQPGTPLALGSSAFPLDHHHMLRGVTCETCHGAATTPGPVSTEQCLACHGPLEELAARTAGTRPTNPHSTPHGPTFAQCDLCHQAHREPENFCAQCHDFDFRLP